MKAIPCIPFAALALASLASAQVVQTPTSRPTAQHEQAANLRQLTLRVLGMKKTRSGAT